MPSPCLTLSNYRSIIEALGSQYGERGRNRPDLFSFQKTNSRSYSGVRVRSVLDTGMEAYWIRDSTRSGPEAIHLILADRNFMDWTRRTDIGMACFVRGMIYDPCYGTLPVHPHSFPKDVYSRQCAGLDDFMNQASPELQDFVAKNILFNLE
jgi:hypothetical protein